MPDTNIPDTNTPDPESGESFDQLLSEYEQSHRRAAEDGARQLQGTVIAVSDETVFLDIGYKTEGVLPRSAFAGAKVNPGDKLLVSVKGRNEEGYYELSRTRERRPTDWDSLQRAFDEKAVIAGTVTGVVKGGLSVDLGVRAFMPASRSGTRDAAEMEQLVGQEIRCRITKLDVADEDVVVDRRAVIEQEERALKQRRYEELREGDTVEGVIRSVTDYGAFVDIGGVDALLHVSDIAWGRIGKPADALAPGQQIEARVLKIDPEKGRISIGLKQLQPHPWDLVSDRYRAGLRVRGVVTRVVEFGAFVELEPGIEGLIHVSEMSWAKRVNKPSDVVKAGDTVEAVILGVNSGERRISLGLKQARGDPWAETARKYPVGSAVEGPVTSITSYGAFVQIAEGVEGLVHVSQISAEKRINHPKDVLSIGEVVRAQVLAVDEQKRQFRLSIKQLVPTDIDEYLAEHKPGDVVSGRIVDLAAGHAQVELGEGIQASCRISEAIARPEARAEAKGDLSSLTLMLAARWKGGESAASKPEPVAAGQVRSFRIARLDPAAKRIELELA